MDARKLRASVIGCGYVGFPLARRLVARGIDVRGSTTTPEKLDVMRAAGIEARLFSTASARDVGAADLFEADIVVVNIPPGRRDPDRLAAYSSHMSTLAAALDPEAYTIFVSSTSVYPDLSRDVTESDARSDASSSAGALLEAEAAFMARTGGSIVVRFGGLYGYERQPSRFFAGRSEIPGGRVPVNMIHRDDAVALLEMLASRRPPPTVMNACAPWHPSRAEFYGIWSERAGLPRPEFLQEEVPFKVVRCEELQRTGFAFAYPDPMLPAP